MLLQVVNTRAQVPEIFLSVTVFGFFVNRTRGLAYVHHKGGVLIMLVKASHNKQSRYTREEKEKKPSINKQLPSSTVCCSDFYFLTPPPSPSFPPPLVVGQQQQHELFLDAVSFSSYSCPCINCACPPTDKQTIDAKTPARTESNHELQLPIFDTALLLLLFDVFPYFTHTSSRFLY